MISENLKRKVLTLIHPFADFFANTSWRSIKSLFNGGLYYRLKEEDHNILRRALAKNYYIICIGGHPNLAAFLIKCATYIRTGKWPLFTHVLMNIDNITDPLQSDKFQLIEAIDRGVVCSSFMEVFDCDAVALLRPKNFNSEQWDAAIDSLKDDLGKPYDSLFNLLDDSELSCVELVRNALRHNNPNYESEFPNLEKEIFSKHDLVPQMFFDNKDFEVITYINRSRIDK